MRLMQILLLALILMGISGSTRKDSCNSKLINEAVSYAKARRVSAQVIDLSLYDIPLYNGDDEASGGLPPAGRALRSKLLTADRLIIATPEYNGGISPLLKNVIDWMSRGPEGGPNRDVFKGKKVLVLSASPGQGGGARALQQLRELLTNVGAEVISYQMALPNAYQAFDAEGHLVNPLERQQLQAAVDQLLQ